MINSFKKCDDAFFPTPMSGKVFSLRFGFSQGFFILFARFQFPCQGSDLHKAEKLFRNIKCALGIQTNELYCNFHL